MGLQPTHKTNLSMKRKGQLTWEYLERRLRYSVPLLENVFLPMSYTVVFEKHFKSYRSY